MNELLSLLLSFGYVGALSGFYTLLRHRDEFVARKVLHALVGNAVFIPLLLGARLWAAALPPLAFSVANYWLWRRGFWRGPVGLVTYPLSVMGMTFLGYLLHPHYLVVPAVVLAYGDSAAALVGRKLFGREQQSWQGSTAMLLVSLAACLPFLQLPDALVVSWAATLAEGHGWDNLTVPAAAAVALALLRLY